MAEYLKYNLTCFLLKIPPPHLQNKAKKKPVKHLPQTLIFLSLNTLQRYFENHVRIVLQSCSVHELKI